MFGHADACCVRSAAFHLIVGAEHHAVALRLIHVFAHAVDEAALHLEAIVIVVSISVRQRRTHLLFDNHDIAVGVDAAEVDTDIRSEQLSNFSSEKVGDLFPAHHVRGSVQRDRRGVGCRRQPFGFFHEDLRNPLRIAGFERVPRGQNDALAIFGVHFAGSI